MGNVVGTIQWQKNAVNPVLLGRLEKLRVKYGLELADHLYLPYDSTKTKSSYGVEINGLRLGWTGKENAETMIKAYLFDAQKLCQEYGLESKTAIEFFPL